MFVWNLGEGSFLKENTLWLFSIIYILTGIRKDFLTLERIFLNLTKLYTIRSIK